MKKIYILVFILISVNKILFAEEPVDFKSLKDGDIILKVGTFDVTVADLKLYMSGYHSIKKWDRYSVEYILNKLIFNLLYMNGCADNKLFITDVEMDYYTNNFLNERSLNPKDKESIELYFSQNEPYSSFEDFFIKSSFYLNKIKYLSNKGYLKQVKSKNIFFDTTKLDKTKKQNLKDEVMNLTRDVTQIAIFNEVAQKNKTNSALTIIEKNNQTKKFLNDKDIDRILSVGLFTPIFVEGKDGFYIFLNYEYIFSEDEKLILDVTEELSKKYAVSKFMLFSDK
ncbi:MAG TPA: hypothetical protein PK771_08250 [Spirochaetota bacterium]|nr:hypothetical protein [Spirochaetota bacterium]